MRVVLDTSVVVAAFRSPAGVSAEMVRRCRAGRLRLVLTTPLLLEYESVAGRPEHLSAAEATTEDLGRFLDALCAIGEGVVPTWLWRPQLRDPDDEMVLEAAVCGQAHIVTFNVRDFGPAGQFGVRVMEPRDAIREF